MPTQALSVFSNSSVEMSYNLHLICTYVVTPRWRHDTVTPFQRRVRASLSHTLSPIGDRQPVASVIGRRDSGALLAAGSLVGMGGRTFPGYERIGGPPPGPTCFFSPPPGSFYWGGSWHVLVDPEVTHG